MSEGDKDENLSPKQYLNLIRPYLRDLINKYKVIEELNNNNNNNNNSNNNNNNNNNDADRGEWKNQLKMHINCIFTRSFKEKCTMHPVSEPVEIFMGSERNDAIDRLFNTFLQTFQKSQMNEEANLFLIVLNYYIMIFKE